MKRILVPLLAGCSTLVLSAPAPAGNNSQASIAVHIGPGTQKNLCDAAGSLTASTVVSEVQPGNCGTGLDYNVYVLVCNGSSVGNFVPEGTGVAGAEFGIQYGPGLTIQASARCADLDFPSADWPDPGSGTVATFSDTNCQSAPSEPFVPNSTIALLYGFNVFLTGPEQFSITARPASGLAQVADCDAVEDDITSEAPSHLGIGGFCASGYSPCGLPTPVEESTWGRVKSQFPAN
jgi:hypothetical protein